MFLKFQNVIINMKNIAFIKKEGGKYFCQYRKKASVKEIEIPISFGDLDDSKYFMKHNFYRLGKYFINPNSINFINTVPIKDSPNITVHFTFVNGLELFLTIESGRFTVWSDNRLRNTQS